MINHPPKDRMPRPAHIRSRIAVRPLAVLPPHVIRPIHPIRLTPPPKPQ